MSVQLPDKIRKHVHCEEVVHIVNQKAWLKPHDKQYVLLKHEFQWQQTPNWLSLQSRLQNRSQGNCGKTLFLWG